MPVRSDRSTPAPILVLLALCCVSATGLIYVPFITAALLKDTARTYNNEVVRVRAFVCTNGLKTCTKTAKMAFAPADVVVEAFVPAHRDNRRLRIGFACHELGELNEDPAEYPIDGERGPTLFRWERRGVSYPCQYVGVALVDSTRRTRGSAISQPVVILSPHE